MRVRDLALAAGLGALLTGCAAGMGPGVSQAELVRRTQEILDGVTAGNPKPFERYYADDCLVHDEKGRSMGKKALVADITPPPRDWSGSLRISHPESRITGGTAILSYDLEESETISGQTVTARYHTTDTWVRRAGDWRIIAEQALRYYADPAPSAPELSKYPDYVGAYELVPGKRRDVLRKGDELLLQSQGKPAVALTPEAGDLFFRRGVEGRILFRRGEGGTVEALIDRRNNEDIVWKRVDAQVGRMAPRSRSLTPRY